MWLWTSAPLHERRRARHASAPSSPRCVTGLEAVMSGGAPEGGLDGAHDVGDVSAHVLVGEEVDGLAEQLEVGAAPLLALAFPAGEVALLAADFRDDRQRCEVEVDPGHVSAVAAV